MQRRTRVEASVDYRVGQTIQTKDGPCEVIAMSRNHIVVRNAAGKMFAIGVGRRRKARAKAHTEARPAPGGRRNRKERP